MMAHCLARALGVGSQNCANNLIVFAERMLGLTRHKLERSKWRDPLTEISCDTCNAGTVRPLIDRFMKLSVEQGKILFITLWSFGFCGLN
jgi:hypothetical protein